MPTFVDKPLAYDVKDALSIVAMAKRRRVPILSLFMLRCVPEACETTAAIVAEPARGRLHVVKRVPCANQPAMYELDG